MAVIFGSETVAEEVYAVLAALPAVTNVIPAARIIPLSVVPENVALPAALHYMENGTYDGAIGQPESSERMRYVVRFTCVGESTTPIKSVAEAAFLALRNHEATRDGAYVGFQVSGEWPLTTVLEGGVLYRQLGFYLNVDLTQGG
jgi:hypothetical protein